MTVQARGIPLTRRQRLVGLFALMSSTTIALTGQFLISPILVFQLSQKGLSPAQIGLFTSASWIGLLLSTPFVARFSAWVGIRPALILSLVIPCISLIGIMMSESVLIWVVLFGLTGLGSALRWIVGEALIADLSPPAWRGRIVGLFQMLLGASFVAAPSLLAWLGPTNPSAQWLSLTLLLCGLGLTYLMPVIDNTLDVGQSLGGRGLLKIAQTSPLVVTAGFVAGFFELGISSVLPVYGMALGFGAAMAAMLIAASGVGSTIVMLPVGIAADRYGAARPAIVCALALVVCSLLLPMAVYYPWLAWVATITWGAAGGALYTLTMIRIGRQHRGAALINVTSLLVLSYTLGGLTGPMLSGLAMEVSVQWALSTIYLVISLLALLVLTRRRFWYEQS